MHFRNHLFLSILLTLSLFACSTDNTSEQPAQEQETGQEDPPAPLVIRIESVNDITQNKATVNLSVSNGDPSSIQAVGLAWGLDPDPVVGENSIELGTTNGSYSTVLDCLDVAKNYYIRGYVMNGSEITYGPQFNFQTLEHIVYEGYLNLYSQQEVDDFGDQGYTKIDGNLWIKGLNSSITSIAALSSLIEVQGSHEGFGIFIEDTELTDLQGLENLRVIDGTFYMDDNEQLNSFSSLEKLKEITGALIVRSTGIRNFSGLENLEFIGIGDPGYHGAGLRLRFCDNLESFEGLSNLEVIEGGLGVSDCPLIRDFEGLVNLERVGTSNYPGYVGIGGNVNMSFYGLESLQDIYGVNIGGTDMESIEGMEVFSGFLLSLRIAYNDNLQNLEFLSSFSQLRKLEMFYNNSLTSLEGLNNLATVESRVTIDGHQSMQSLNGLSSLIRVGDDIPFEGYLSISDNPVLDDFCDLRLSLLGSDVNFSATDNLYNPTKADLLNGDCTP